MKYILLCKRILFLMCVRACKQLSFFRTNKFSNGVASDNNKMNQLVLGFSSNFLRHRGQFHRIRRKHALKYI